MRLRFEEIFLILKKFSFTITHIFSETCYNKYISKNGVDANEIRTIKSEKP